MKASPSQIFKEAESLKASLSGEGLSSNDVWQKRQELCHLFESLLLMDLDYALDKKVEQDLWSFIFRNPIAACQSKAREHKKSNNNFINSQLTTLLETAGGFYFQLLQKLCCAYDMDLPSHSHDSVYGLTKDWISQYPVAHQPRKSSLLYICQHCLVHMGDIARYRGQSLQAENFYRHAVELVPSNGQPYNQLALLEAASGEKLSTVFFHVRSLCVLHPFPVAATNLHNLFSKMSSDITIPEGKPRISAFEYVTVFLQFHSIIHLSTDLKKAETMVGRLTNYLPALIIAEKFETWQLVQMVAVCLFAHEHAWGTADVDKSSTHLDVAMLSADELKSAALIEELIASMLHAFLFPVHSFPEPKETASYYTLPAVKVILDWMLQDPQILHHETITKNPQVWHCLCILLNHVDVTAQESYDLKKYEDRPLPEDWDLQAFLPLKKSQGNLKFNLNAATPSDEVAIWLRAVRLSKLGVCLADIEGVNLLSFTETGRKRVFKTVHQAECITDEVLQQIQELSVASSPSLSSDSSALTNGNSSGSDIPSTSLRSKSIHNEGVPQQEVRFKLDDAQQWKDKSENERQISSDKTEHRNKENLLGTNREKRSSRQNVAMQAIFQQRAAQMSTTAHGRILDNGKDTNLVMHHESTNRQNSRPQNHLDNSHHIRPASENCLSSQTMKEVNINRPVHHMPSEQYNQFQQQTHAMNGVSNQQCDPKEAWIQQYNLHQASINPANQINRDANFVQNTMPRIVRAPHNFNFQQQQQQQQQTQPPPPTPQQPNPPNQIMSKQMGFITTNPPNVLWNYMGAFVAPYQQGNNQQLLVQQSNNQPVLVQQGNNQQVLVQQGSNQPAQRQQPGAFYVMNGTPQQEMEPNMLHAAYRNQPNGSALIQPQPELIRDQVQEHLVNQARMWQQENGRTELTANHIMNQVVGRPVSQNIQNALSAQQLQGAGSSVSSHELCSNTYSLFNSPWPSGITIPRANKESQHNMDTVFMQSRIQSLWSGPGPSPLERLLEQQKQRRDGATQ